MNGAESASGSDDILILKFGVLIEHAQMRAIGVIVFDRSINKLEAFVFGMGSSKHRFSEPNFTRDWHEIKGAIIKAQMKGETADKLSKELVSKLRSAAMDKDSDLNKAMVHRDPDATRMFLGEFFGKEMQDTSVKSAVSLASQSRKRFEEGGGAEEASESDDSGSGEEKLSENRFDCRLVLSPVKGMPVNRLPIGTKVMGTIPLNEANKDILQDLALEVSDGRARVSGRVVSVDTLDPLNVKVGLVLAPGIFAFARTSAEVMVWASVQGEDPIAGAASATVPGVNEDGGTDKLAARDFAAIFVSAVILLIVILFILLR